MQLVDVKNIIQEEVIQFQLGAVVAVMEAEVIVVAVAAAVVLADIVGLVDTVHKQAPVAAAAAGLILAMRQVVVAELEFMVKVAAEQEESILTVFLVGKDIITEEEEVAEVVAEVVDIPTNLPTHTNIIWFPSPVLVVQDTVLVV